MKGLVLGMRLAELRRWSTYVFMVGGICHEAGA